MEYQEIQNRVKEILPEKRYEHTLRVVEVAKHLAKIHGANVEKAALAALVHDVCKPIRNSNSKSAAAAQKKAV